VKSKVVFQNEQLTDLMVPIKKDQKLRTVSTFESVIKGKHKLTQHERDHLKTVQDVLKKVDELIRRLLKTAATSTTLSHTLSAISLNTNVNSWSISNQNIKNN
jgi:hypothetical protein